MASGLATYITHTSTVVFSCNLSKNRVRQSIYIYWGGSLIQVGEMAWLCTKIQEQLFFSSGLVGQKITRSYQSWDIWYMKVFCNELEMALLQYI